MNKTRMNANIDSSTYNEFNVTVTEAVEKLIRKEIRKKMYQDFKNAFNDLADERATVEAMKIERECINDGI